MKTKKTRFVTFHTFYLIKKSILPVFLPLSAIEKLFALKQKETGGILDVEIWV